MMRRAWVRYSVLTETNNPDPLWAAYRWDNGQWVPWNNYVDSEYIFQRDFTTVKRAKGMVNYILTSKKFPDVKSVTMWRRVYILDKSGTVSIKAMSGCDYSLRSSKSLVKRKVCY